MSHRCGMQPWTANLIGLALGSALGAMGLAMLLPSEPAPQPPAVATKQTPPLPPPARPQQPTVAAIPAPKPIELPTVSFTPPQPDALPNIIHPDTPPNPGGGACHAGAVCAGTGFFVATDGSLITASHVVSQCRQIRLASLFIKHSTAELIASDTKQDIALLRASQVKPPAYLSVGRPIAPTKQLVVLGYPASADLLVPSETRATLENDRLQPAPPAVAEVRNMVLMEAPSIGHGYSGGPIIDPRGGTVIGIVRATLKGDHLHAERPAIPASGMVIGPGFGIVADFLRHEAVSGGASTASLSTEDVLNTARRATVHVFCLP